MKKRTGKVLAVLTAVLLLLSLWGCRADSSGGKKTYVNGYREPLTEGVKNTITNALYMYNTFWTPLETVSAWSTSKESQRKFVEGHTYRGIPYGQPVHKGAYVGSIATVEEFCAAVEDSSSLFYTDRGENTYYYTTENGPIKYSPYYSNDCSGFVSAAMGIGRHTTRDIGGNPDRFPVKSSNVYDAKPGDLINSHEGGHVILVLDVVYDSANGKMISAVTIEQTPDIIIMRSYGIGGANGSIEKLRERMTSGKYYLCRYKNIDNVKLMDGALEGLPKTVNCISEPSSLLSADNVCEGNLYVDFGKNSAQVKGFSLSSEKIAKIEYSAGGGTYKTASTAQGSEYTSPIWGFSYLENSKSFSFSIPASELQEGSVVKVRAKTSGGNYYEIANLTVKRAPDTVPFVACIDSYGIQFDCYRIPDFEEDGSQIALNGWCTADDIVRFEIKTDSGSWYPLGQYFREDVYDYKRYDYPNCVECNAFNCGVDVSILEAGTHTVTVRAVASDGLAFKIFSVTAKTEGLTAAAKTLIISGSILVVLLSAAAVVTVILIKKRKRKKDFG